MKLRKLSKRMKSEKTILNSFFVFDTETTKLEPMPKNFVFGVIYGYNFHKVIKTVKDFKLEFQKKKYKGKYIFAHNAEFDLLTIFGNIYQNLDSKAIFNGKFIMAKNNDVTYADSLNILLQSVEKIGEKLGIKKHENEKIKGQSLTKKNITSEDINYCIRDCQIVYDSLAKIFIEIGTIKMTLASISLYIFRKQYLKSEMIYSDYVYDFYDSYYGGRTEVFQLGKTKSKVYDLNSLYPFVMENMLFPDISKLTKYEGNDIEYLEFCLKRYEGMAKIDVYHKKSYFGYLPFRGENKLLFPVGNFTTIINFNELRFALEANIIEIKKVYYIISSHPIKSPFTEFVNDNYRKRFKSHSEFDKFFYKLILNSLYGKFSQKKKYQDEYYSQIPYEIISELQKTGDFYQLNRFNSERDDCFLTTINKKTENSFFAIPTFSSYITSQARITLLKGLLDNENNKVTYCDTDSIFLEDNFNGNLGTNLGQWKLEDKKCLEINGLKNYVYIEDGIVKEAIKGINKNAIKVNKSKYLIKKYFKTKESLRRNREAGESFTMTKNLTHIYDKRIIIDGKQTRAIEL